MENNNDNFKDLDSLFEREDTSYTYERQRKSDNRAGSARSLKHRRNQTKKMVIFACLVVVMAVLWVVAAYSIVDHVLGIGVEVSDTETDEATDSSAETEEQIVPTGPSYISVTMAANAYKDGKLILINSTYKYDSSADKKLADEIVPAKPYCNGTFDVTYNTEQIRIDTIGAMNEMFEAFKKETGKTGYSLRPDYGFCLTSQQQEWFDKTYQKRGESAVNYEFRGGESEHETGRAFDIKVISGTSSLFIREADEVYKWIYDNCYKYGIIYRYPSTKMGITNVSMAATSTHADHFRYVGKPAAMLMQQNGWCLEEFLIEIEKYTYNGDHLKVSDIDGNEYELYYYPANVGAETQVKIPEDTQYEISGNNIGGYIVTLKLAKE